MGRYDVTTCLVLLACTASIAVVHGAEDLQHPSSTQGSNTNTSVLVLPSLSALPPAKRACPVEDDSYYDGLNFTTDRPDLALVARGLHHLTPAGTDGYAKCLKYFNNPVAWLEPDFVLFFTNIATTLDGITSEIKEWSKIHSNIGNSHACYVFLQSMLDFSIKLSDTVDHCQRKLHSDDPLPPFTRERSHCLAEIYDDLLRMVSLGLNLYRSLLPGCDKGLTGGLYTQQKAAAFASDVAKALASIVYSSGEVLHLTGSVTLVGQFMHQMDDFWSELSSSNSFLSPNRTSNDSFLADTASIVCSAVYRRAHPECSLLSISIEPCSLVTAQHTVETFIEFAGLFTQPDSDITAAMNVLETSLSVLKPAMAACPVVRNSSSTVAASTAQRCFTADCHPPYVSRLDDGHTTDLLLDEMRGSLTASGFNLRNRSNKDYYAFPCALSCKNTYVNSLSSSAKTTLGLQRAVTITVLLAYAYSAVVAFVNRKRLLSSLPWRALLYVNCCTGITFLMNAARVFEEDSLCRPDQTLLRDGRFATVPRSCALSVLANETTTLLLPLFIVWQTFCWFIYTSCINTVECRAAVSKRVGKLKIAEMIALVFCLVLALTPVLLITNTSSPTCLVNSQAFGLPCQVAHPSRHISLKSIPAMLRSASAVLLCMSIMTISNSAVSKYRIGRIPIIGLSWVPDNKVRPSCKANDTDVTMRLWQRSLWWNLAIVLADNGVMLTQLFFDPCLLQGSDCPLVQQLKDEIRQLTLCQMFSCTPEKCNATFKSTSGVHSKFVQAVMLNMVSGVLEVALLYWVWSAEVARPGFDQLSAYIHHLFPGWEARRKTKEVTPIAGLQRSLTGSLGTTSLISGVVSHRVPVALAPSSHQLLMDKQLTLGKIAEPIGQTGRSAPAGFEEDTIEELCASAPPICDQAHRHLAAQESSLTEVDVELDIAASMRVGIPFNLCVDTTNTMDDPPPEPTEDPTDYDTSNWPQCKSLTLSPTLSAPSWCKRTSSVDLRQSLSYFCKFQSSSEGSFPRLPYVFTNPGFHDLNSHTE